MGEGEGRRWKMRYERIGGSCMRKERREEGWRRGEERGEEELGHN